jgi:hypothetical protein
MAHASYMERRAPDDVTTASALHKHGVGRCRGARPLGRLLGKWLLHARLRLEKGKVPFEPGELAIMGMPSSMQ